MKQGKLHEAVQAIICNALHYFQWNRTKTAKELGISVRGLNYKINQYKKLGVDIPSNPTNVRKHKIRAKLKAPIIRVKKRG